MIITTDDGGNVTSFGSRLKSIIETLTERDSLKQLFNSITAQWERNKGDYGVPIELSDRYSLVAQMRPFLMRNGASSPELVFDFLSEYGCLRIHVWAVNYTKREMLVERAIYALGKDGTVRGKGETAFRNTSELLQKLSDASGYTIREVIVTNQKSSRFVSEDASISDIDLFLRNFFTDKTAERRKAMEAGIGLWDAKVKVYTPGVELKDIYPEDIRAVKKMMEMAGIT